MTNTTTTSSGPYQQWITRLTETGYANLKFLDEMMTPDKKPNDATCKILTFSATGALGNSRTVCDADFDESLIGTSKRLFILEGLSRTHVEKLGSTFSIEPEFFASHLRSVTWEHKPDRSDASMLPSIRRQTKFWTLEYLECVQLVGKFRLGRTKLEMSTPGLRRLFIRNPAMDVAKEDWKSVGLANRIVSYWKQPAGNGNFDALLLVDPPLKARLRFHYDSGKTREKVTTTWSPYGDGFIDFANIDKRKLFAQCSPHNTKSRDGSITDSLLWRLENAEVFTSEQNAAIEVILQRLILSQWMLTLAFLRRDFNSISVNRLTHDNLTQSQVKSTLSDLDACHALLDRCSYLVRKNLIQLNIPMDGSNNSLTATTAAPHASEAHFLKMDWAFVWQELQHHITSTTHDLNLRLANLSVLDSKRSRDDSERSSLITKLGQILLLVFTPAAFAYGILSMGDEFLPGKKRFWVFFVVAVPLSVITIIVFYVWVWLEERGRERGRKDGGSGSCWKSIIRRGRGKNSGGHV